MTDIYAAFFPTYREAADCLTTLGYEFKASQHYVRGGTTATIEPSVKGATVRLNGAPFRIGERVELHPGTDFWMRGARYGEVRKIEGTLAGLRVKVRLDVTGRRGRLHGFRLMDIGKRM